MQLVYHLLHHLRVAHIGVLGHFQLEEVGRDRVFLDKIGDDVHQIRVIQIDSGHVYRDGRGRHAVLEPLMKQKTDRLPHKVIQFGNKSVPLENRNEFVGRDHALLGVVPPYQRFPARGPVCEKRIFWLQIDAKLLLFQRV